MCGRYTANTEDEVIEIRGILAALSMRLSSKHADYALAAQADFYGKEIRPSDKTPIITKNENFSLAKFGFDKWDDSGLIINARSETVSTSRFFSPFINKRCIIPASYYFEWKKAPHAPAEKYILGAGNKSGIFMAGLINTTPGKEGFVILTKAADENIRFIHDRMPVILPASQINAWFDGTIGIDFISRVCVPNISYEKAV